MFAIADWALFGSGFYRALLAPDSSTGSFERALGRVDAASRDATRDVLVLGDSRIFSGLDATTANAAGGGLRFINAGVPGTTPRCWNVFARTIDPHASRYRAVVLSVDTYADDDGAIGSVDGNDRAFDLKYIVFHATPGDIWNVATSFPTFDGRVTALFELFLRGPLLREDVQSLLALPRARAVALAASRQDAPALRVGSLAGLRVDFARDVVQPPPGYPAAGLAELNRQILLRPSASASYGRYRRQWLGAVVDRYRARGVPVIIVRLPTRPRHRSAPAALSGSLGDLAARSNVAVLLQDGYVALERPEYFVDADHLNQDGARRFSRMLGRDVAGALRKPAAFGKALTGAVTPAIAATPRHHRFAPLTPLLAALSIGVPIRFQSYEFATFLAIVVMLFYASHSRNVRRALLLGASWYFYARWNAWYLAVLIALTATDYVFALVIERTAATARRGALVCAIGVNLAFLATAKYADFFTGWTLHILVPVGISFHTFQSISYVVDVYRGRIRAVRSATEYALYLAFFPQLLAGPIVRAGRFFGELAGRLVARRIDNGDIATGCWQILKGLIKKSVVADRFAAVSDAYFGSIASHPGSPAAWGGALAFAMQIYFDFSGYSDMAIGSARLLGFRFPQNFRRPYLAWSPVEFWRRWHITLSRWLRDYLYIPLGGNRRGSVATLRNLMVTMLLGGLWHGASWTFVAWGGYHGALLCGQRLVDSWTFARRRAALARIVACGLTFTFVLFGWVLFRAQNFPDALSVVLAMLRPTSGPMLLDTSLLLLTATTFALEIWREVARPRLWRLPLGARASATAAMLLVLELGSYPGRAAPFIYFHF